MDTSPVRKPLSPAKVVSFLAGLAILYLLFSQIDFQDLSRLLLAIKPWYLLSGGILYLIKASVRAYRTMQLNQDSRLKLIRVLRLTLASSLISQVLPFKLGELSYVYLLKKESRLPTAQGISSLALLRIFDVLAVALLFLAIATGEGLPGRLAAYYVPLLLFIAGILLFLGIWMLISRRAGFALAGKNRNAMIFSLPIVAKLIHSMEQVATSLKQYKPARVPGFVLWACLEWLVNYAVFHVILVGMGFSPTFFVTVASVSFSILASVLPINSLGNFGTQEAGWATGMILMGFSRVDAIASGFATHLITLGYFLLLGGFSWTSYWFESRTGTKVTNE